jgi:hypothetical protein
VKWSGMCFDIGKFFILNEAERNERDEGDAKLFLESWLIFLILF